MAVAQSVYTEQYAYYVRVFPFILFFSFFFFFHFSFFHFSAFTLNSTVNDATHPRFALYICFITTQFHSQLSCYSVLFTRPRRAPGARTKFYACWNYLLTGAQRKMLLLLFYTRLAALSLLCRRSRLTAAAAAVWLFLVYFLLPLLLSLSLLLCSPTLNNSNWALSIRSNYVLPARRGATVASYDEF